MVSLRAATARAAEALMKIPARWFSGAVVLGAIASGPASAVDGVSIQGGVGAGPSEGSGTEMFRLAAQWDWKQRWFEGRDWHVGGFWDAGVGYWKRDALPQQNGSLYEIGLTPVFRLQKNQLEGPYIEAGIGAHLLSDTSLGDRIFSTSFQFGSHLGIGYRFGARNAFDLSYSYQHLSNASIKQPNDGIDFHQIRLQYHF
jgi:hypothetical protein